MARSKPRPESSGLRPGGAVRVGVLGYGTVGSALVSRLRDEADAIEARSGVRFEVVKVAVRDPSHPRAGLPPELITGDPKELVTDSHVDVVVELIGGLDPAGGLVEA